MWSLRSAVVLCCALVYSHAANVTQYRGRLTPRCAALYYRQYVTRVVPARTYRYLHEIREQRHGDDVSFRIVGGKRVSITEVPYNILYGLYCGGALIAPDWAITAAHCSEKDDFILAGHTRRSLATRHPVCAHYTHPAWAGLKSHPHDWDYQLLQLEEPVVVGPTVRPIAIGTFGDISDGRMIAVTGWGHTHYKDKMQDYLRRVLVPIMGPEECRLMPLESYRELTPRMFCGGFLNGTKDACQGDSGGPAVVSARLVGLVSFGVGCGERMQPGVYASVPAAREWIREVTALPL